MDRRKHALLAAVASLALAFEGCAAGATSSATQSPEPSAGPTTIDVQLQEWAVVPATTSAAAGPLTFNVTNSGPDDVHEFVVLRTDLDAGALPTDENGAAEEEGAGIEAIGEVEDLEVGDTQQLQLTLTPGKYILICNLYNADENEAHYAMGMRIGFEVTD